MAQVIGFDELAHWQPTRPTYGVLGCPIAHSLSPAMHGAALVVDKADAEYLAFEVPPDGLETALQMLHSKGVAGLNLTVPHKQMALAWVSEVSPEAKQIGATNTLLRTSSGWSGHNTDGRGFAKAVRDIFRYGLKELRVLVVGCGGAGRAVAFQCAREGCERLVLANRSADKACALADELAPLMRTEKLLGQSDRLKGMGLAEASLKTELDQIDLIVNCTSLGLKAADPSPVPAEWLQPHHLIFDTIYNPPQTQLLQAASDVGARGINGLSMLLHQGALAYEIWFGHSPSLEAMRKTLMPHA